MDLPISVGQPPDGAEEEAPGPVEAMPAPEVEPEPTLADVHERLASLSGRVDALAASFEGSLRRAVAEEVQKVAGELQHTVAALGRILVRDLGKLNQILAEHRDTLVAEVRKGTSGVQGTTTPVEPSGPATTDPGSDTRTNEGEPVADGGGAPSGGGGTAVDDTGSSSRHWRRRKA